MSCHGNTAGGPKQSFVGIMVYDRYWFDKDLFGFTLGGGVINNPGRYLVPVSYTHLDVYKRQARSALASQTLQRGRDSLVSQGYARHQILNLSLIHI